MPGSPAVLISDRSQLAANLYRLLLAPLGVAPLIRRRASDAITHIKRGGSVSLFIVGANSLGSSAAGLVREMGVHPVLARTEKLFICGPSKAEQALLPSLRALPRSRLIARPFHPQDLAREVQRRTGGATI